jgi:hypothetical protein
MYCYYCLQPISDRSPRCPECGSRLTESAAESSDKPRELSGPGSGMFAIAALLVIILPVLACGVVGWLRPSLLPSSMVAMLARETPPPPAAPQAARAVFVTPTPLSWQEHSNRQLNFTISFPASWSVLNQAQRGWQRFAQEEAKRHTWADDVYQVDLAPNEPRTRAVDVDTWNLSQGKVAIFNITATSSLGEDLTLSQLEEWARAEPLRLVALTGPQDTRAVTSQRTERTQLDGREALLVEYATESELLDKRMRGRIRLYFVQTELGVLAITYFAEEQLAGSNRALYEQVVQSFRVNE